MLKLVGYWNETESSTRWIDPNWIVGFKWGRVEHEQVVRYLRAGVCAQEELGYSWCRVDRSIPDQEMGCTDLTDGCWMWPEGLSIYVDKFSIELPPLFLGHIRVNCYRIPEQANSFNSYEGDLDASYWDAWCQEIRQRRN